MYEMLTYVVRALVCFDVVLQTVAGSLAAEEEKKMRKEEEEREDNDNLNKNAVCIHLNEALSSAQGHR